MKAMTPNYHCNHGYSTAEIIIHKIATYLKNPTEAGDRRQDFGLLIKNTDEFKNVLNQSHNLLQNGATATPNQYILDLLRHVDQFTSEVLAKTEGLSIAADQVNLHNDIRFAGS
jgi:hypothetical protein